MTSLPVYWPWALGAVMTLALMILAALVMLLRKGFSEKPNPGIGEQEETAASPAEVTKGDFAGIRSAFRKAKSVMRSRGEGNVYETPLVLVIGAEGSRDAGFLKQTDGPGLTLHFSDPVKDGFAFADGREFLFFDGGAVLDVAGEPVLGSDGKHGDDVAWRRIMSNLVEMRPKRPADAVVLTVSCRELKQAAHNEPLRLALADAARHVRDRLWDLQEKTGFRLPLYVLVTNCEVLDGFGETATALPFAERAQILGWSSPYGVQQPYQSKWIDETFSAVRQALCDLQMELFSAGSQTGEVMLFPWSFGVIAEPLRTFLDPLFSPGARHESNITRGIYFCGEREKRTVFAAELFAQKIFPEAGLATPASATRITRSRKAKSVHIATAALAVLAFAGLGLGWLKLDERRRKVIPLLDEATADLRLAPSKVNQHGPDGAMPSDCHAELSPNDELLGNAATRVLQRMSAIDFARFGPRWLPATWFGTFDGDLHMAVVHSFEAIVLSSVNYRLQARECSAINELIVPINNFSPADGVNVQDKTLSDAPVDQVERTAELIKLRTFVRKMQEIETQGNLFNRVATAGDGDPEALKSIIQYSFGLPLPDQFVRQRGAYQSAVRQLSTEQRFHPETYAGKAGEAAVNQSKALYVRLFQKNPSAWRVEKIASVVNPASLNLASQDQVSSENFRALDGTIHRLAGDLSSPAVAWSFRQPFDLGPEFTEVLSMIEASHMFEGSTAKTIRADGTDGLRTLQRSLAAMTGFGFPVLRQSTAGAPLPQLSDVTQGLETALETVLGQGVVPPDSTASSILRRKPGYYLVWDTSQIDEVMAAYRGYNEFRDTGLKGLPTDFARILDRAAQQNTVKRMTELLAKAQRFEPLPPEVNPVISEEQLRLQAVTFEESAKVIRTPLAALQVLHAPIPRHDVIAATSAEAVRLLQSTDNLLNAGGLYLPKAGNFDWWNGDTAPALAAWGVHDNGELTEYLDTTRARVSMLAENYAAPGLRWLAEFAPSNPPNPDLVARWQTIGNDLTNFKAKKPGNAPALLDNYISVRAATVTPADCRMADLTPAERPGRGFFGERLKLIAPQLATQCRFVAENKAAEQYESLALLFNQTLANRYPFSQKLPNAGDVEADPENVRRFFVRFDKSAGFFAAVSSDAAKTWFEPGVKFIRDMRNVRLFFAPFLEDKKALLPEVNVEPQFRVLEEREVGASEVIDWSLTFGRDTATRIKGKKLNWRPDTPVTLTLRWADNAPHVPTPFFTTNNPSINKRTVIYQYTNRWSLLAAMAALRATSDELPANADLQPVTLALNVLTRPEAGGQPDPRHPSVLYVRLSLSGSDGKPLDLPNFPAIAPPLKRLTAEVSP
jgi:type VI secretion system protein ImpL